MTHVDPETLAGLRAYVNDPDTQPDYLTSPRYRAHLEASKRPPGSDPDAKYRLEARRIADQFVYELESIARAHADSDGTWEPPAYLDGSGDGTGLLAVMREQLGKPAAASLERFNARMADLHAQIHADVRERVGPGYNPRPAA